MAFSSSGLTSMVANGLTGSMTWRYMSSDIAQDIEYLPAYVPGSSDQTGLGYFRACGDGGRTASLGMKVGDPIVLVASSAALIPGQVTWMSVLRSTPDQLSTVAATGWAANYNCSVGGTI